MCAMLLQIDDIFLCQIFLLLNCEVNFEKKIGKTCLSIGRKKVITFVRPNKLKN